MRHLVILVWVISLCAATVCPCSRGSASGRSAKPYFSPVLDRTIPELLKRYEVTGVGVGLVENGQVRALRGYGLENREKKQPFTPDTIINVASLSKPVTAWGILRLVEQKRIGLDDSVPAKLKRWTLPPSEFDLNAVTVRRLLSHSAGLSVPSAPWFSAGTPLPTLEQVLDGAVGDRGTVRVEQEPGKQWTYSGGGYTMLQLLTEEISGQPFADFMHQEVFRPLNMADTSFRPSDIAHQRLAALYDEKGVSVKPYRVVGEAAGGLYTSVRDFSRFLAAYTSADRRVLRPASIRQITASPIPVRLTGVKNARYGLGHGVHRARTGETIVYHSGGNPGVLAYFLLSLPAGNGMVIVTNSEKGLPLLKEVIRLWGQHYKIELQPLY